MPQACQKGINGKVTLGVEWWGWTSHRTPCSLSNFGGRKILSPPKRTTRDVDLVRKLEQIAILLPLLLVPETLINQHIILKTDNIACVFGHQNRLMKGDECASIFIRAVHLICAYLGSTLHVLHSPRCSDWGSVTADKLTREHTTDFLQERMLMRWRHLSIPVVLQQWLETPQKIGTYHSNY